MASTPSSLAWSHDPALRRSAPGRRRAQIPLLGRLEDELRREQGRWLIQHRRIVAQVPGIPREYKARYA